MRPPRPGEALLLLVLVGLLAAESVVALGGLDAARASASSANAGTEAAGAGPTPSTGTSVPTSTPAAPAPGASAPGSPTPTGSVADAVLARLVGQKLMVAMAGTTPSDGLLGRIRRGEIGGVILFSFNIASAAQVRALTQQLQAAAAAGGQPPLLISTDQEGGIVKRLPWAPPTLTPPAMGQLADAAAVQEQGLETGYVLRCAGINNNLAPVADVPTSTASFMYQRGRTWSFDAGVTASLSDAFATGLESGGDVPAMKHFPGLGAAAENTDDEVVTIAGSQADLAPGLLPYQAAIGHGVPMIMLSNATYPAYDSGNAAGWSHAIGTDLLRGTLGFKGVTITDSLSGTAHARGVSATSLARKAARAGTDMILLTGTEQGSARAYARLLEDARAGILPLATLQASYDRILALKATLHAPVADAAPPVVVEPTSRLYAPATLGDGSVPVRTSWSASDPCAVSGYALERKVVGFDWAGQALGAAGSTSIKQNLPIGVTRRYAVRASDGAGNWSARAKGVALQPLLLQSSETNVTYTGAWSRAAGDAFSGGGTRYTSVAGASASRTFTGTSIGWVAALGPTRGAADVYVDGELRQTVDLYAATRARQQVVFVASWSSQGEHTLRIVVKGTPGHPRVDVDAFAQLIRP